MSDVKVILDGQEVLASTEQTILELEEMGSDDFHGILHTLHLEGVRRLLRVPLDSLTWRIVGQDLYLEFFLPKGSYGTTLLRELMKKEMPPEGFYEEGEGVKHGLWRPAEREDEYRVN